MSRKKQRSARKESPSQGAAAEAPIESSPATPAPDSPGLVLVDISFLVVPMFLLLRVMLDVWPMGSGFYGVLAWIGAYLTFCTPLLCMGVIRWWANRKWPGEGQETMLALGLGLLAFIRPWRDGVTFPKDNTFFVWGIVLLFMMWATRFALRGGAFRFKRVLALLAAFMGVVVLTGLSTVRFDGTYRGVLLWTSHALLFLLASNALRSKRAIGIVMGMFVAATFAESFHSLIHLKFYLPQMRSAINEQPQLLALYFRANELTPELRSRLESNRAFGSFLFANALAAYLIVIIPYMVGSAASAWRGLFKTRNVPEKSPTAANPAGRRRTAILTGFALWLGTCVAIFGYYYHFSSAMYDLPSGGVVTKIFGWVRVVGFGRWLFYVGVLPLAAGLAPAYLVNRCGQERTMLAARAVLLPIVTILASVTLWLTYSRGGALALFLACAFVTALLVLARLRGRRTEGSRRSGQTAAVLFLVLAAGLLWDAQGVASSEESVQTKAEATQVAQLRENPRKPIVPQTGAPRKEDRAKKKPRKKAQLDVDGTSLTLNQLSDPTSLRLRMSYWRTGLLMAKDNLWTGVGLGNYGVAYPKYQYLGAGDVKQAHNDPIQLLAETGLFGLLLFGVFWSYTLLWGAWRIINETDPGERWLLSGLYAGVVAFLAHSFVDFNFFNPSLAMFEFLLAGLFFARASTGDAPEPKRLGHQMVAVALLAVAALLAAAGARLYLSERMVGNQVTRDAYLRVGDFFFNRVNPKTFDPKRPPGETASAVALLIPDRNILESFGTLQVRHTSGGTTWRKVGAHEPLPPQAVLVITNPALAQTRAREGIERWLDHVERADAIYPHSADIAAYLFQWHYMLAESARDSQEKRESVLACQKWAQKSVDRSPEQFIFHECLAKALWLRGTVEAGAQQLECYREGLEEYKRTALLYPIEPFVWNNYREALQRLGKAFVNSGDPKTGQAMLAEAEGVTKRIEELQKQREALSPPKRGRKK